ncbi:nuclear export factor GLE1 [Geodermatophilus sp. Leaf369]|uniref:YcnI family copper-binding membrane protein n=1 Tax=Geodermatophilus sp. Leaf369 TaxID=1736354 RepID=UPI0006FBEE16|nr:YcnI family protein [Geodermatophilus sp. Leaf369]KQS60128.1 nuclear export factor GLE1 [Geodermatophilus sp. Leaf369]
MSTTPRRLAVLTLATGIAVAAGGGVASAHVRVSSDEAAPGGFGVMTFRVPNESDTASTVSLRIQLPTDTPLTFVQAEPVAGWTITPTTTQLDPPVESDGEEITSAVTVVQFTADAGGGIAPGQFQEFSLLGGPFPDAETVSFGTVQTYSDGTESAWIEPTVEGQPEPQYPAPVLDLSGSTAASGDAHGSDGGTDTAASATDATAAEDGSGNGIAVTALVLGGLGLVAGVAGLALGLAARRRTVAS